MTVVLSAVDIYLHCSEIRIPIKASIFISSAIFVIIQNRMNLFLTPMLLNVLLNRIKEKA